MRFYAGQFLDEVESCFGIGLSELDDLVVVVLRTFNGRRIAVLDQISGFSRGGVHLLVSFFGLRGALFGHFAECLRGRRHWGVGGLLSCGIGGRSHDVTPKGVSCCGLPNATPSALVGCLFDRSRRSRFWSITNAIARNPYIVSKCCIAI